MERRGRRAVRHDHARHSQLRGLDRVACKGERVSGNGRSSGPLHGDWWKLFTSQFAYMSGLYAFVTLAAIGIFGWLLEARHGPVGDGRRCSSARAPQAPSRPALSTREPIVGGGNAGALALLAAWAVPDLRAAARGRLLRGRPARRRRPSRRPAGDPVRGPGGELAGGDHRRCDRPSGRIRLAQPGPV